MNIAIDQGNTFFKVGVFDQDQLKEVKSYSSVSDTLDHVKNIAPENLIISSVGVYPSDLIAAVNALNVKTINYTHHTPVPIEIQYQTPGTLGADRIAAAVGATKFYQNRNILVIDAGTCITYDFIDCNNVFHGGSISPGLYIKFKALNTFTKNLPLVSPGDTNELIGRTTEQSILSGVIFGTIGEMQSFIDRYNNKFDDLAVLICGGDAKFFDGKIKGTIFAVPELVLIGLNKILLYNVEKV